MYKIYEKNKIVLISLLKYKKPSKEEINRNEIIIEEINKNNFFCNTMIFSFLFTFLNLSKIFIRLLIFVFIY